MSFPFPRPLPPLENPRATADYIYEVTEDRLLVIIDELSAVSVTNDIRNVLADIAQREGLASLAGFRVTYRDSELDWCRVVLSETGRYEQICGFGVRVTCEAEAKRRLRELAV